jgi:hypothetical protein
MPFDMDQGEAVSDELTFVPEVEGDFPGQIVAESNDPVGDATADVWGSGEMGTTCDGIGSGELLFDV